MTIADLSDDVDDHPQITIGRFSIAVVDEKSIAIYVDDGEGGHFSSEAFADVVERFYIDNF